MNGVSHTFHISLFYTHTPGIRDVPTLYVYAVVATRLHMPAITAVRFQLQHRTEHATKSEAIVKPRRFSPNDLPQRPGPSYTTTAFDLFGVL